MPLPLCPRCGKQEKDRHICTGNLEPTQAARKSVRRQEFRRSRDMSPVEIEDEVRKALDEIRAALVRETGKTRVTYSDAIRSLLGNVP